MKFLVAILIMIMASCGAPAPQQPQQPGPQPTPGPTPTPTPGGKTSFAEASAIMQKYCADCHATAPFTKTESALAASSAKNRVQNSTMPPPYASQMSAVDKQKFLGFF